LAKYKFVVKGKMPTLNEYLKAERVNKRVNGKFQTMGNVMKKDWQKRALLSIRIQLKGKRCNPPVNIHYHFFEENQKRDKGNVLGFAEKIIEDALQDAGTLGNDNWQWINNISCEFDIDAKNPRVEVTLTEV